MMASKSGGDEAVPPVMSVRGSTAVSRSCTFLGSGTKMCRDDAYDAVKNPQVSRNYICRYGMGDKRF